MSMIEVTLPDSLREFVEEQAARLGSKTAADYIHDLIRKEQKRLALAKLEELLLEGLNSGPPIVVTDAYWEEIHRRYEERQQAESHP